MGSLEHLWNQVEKKQLGPNNLYQQPNLKIKVYLTFCSELNSFSFEEGSCSGYDIWTSFPNEVMSLREDEADGIALYLVDREPEEYEQLRCKSPEIFTLQSEFKLVETNYAYNFNDTLSSFTS